MCSPNCRNTINWFVDNETEKSNKNVKEFTTKANQIHNKSFKTNEMWECVDSSSCSFQFRGLFFWYANRDWCRFHAIKFGNFSYSLFIVSLRRKKNFGRLRRKPNFSSLNVCVCVSLGYAIFLLKYSLRFIDMRQKIDKKPLSPSEWMISFITKAEFPFRSRFPFCGFNRTSKFVYFS